MNRQAKVILASVLLSSASYICAAAPMPPPPGPPPPVGLPIDSYIIYGVITALFIGARKIVVGINRREN